jgi:hypothetical protein
MAKNQQLSNKDSGLFRQVVRHFENKQYKKGRAPARPNANISADHHQA